MKHSVFLVALVLAGCATAIAPTADPRVVIVTELGEIEIEIYAEAAPLTAVRRRSERPASPPG